MYSVEGNPDSDIIYEWYVSVWNRTSYTGERETAICNVDERNTLQNIVSQIKQGVIVKKRKSQKLQHFDANTDMSKLLTGVITGASKAPQRQIYLSLFFEWWQTTTRPRVWLHWLVKVRQQKKKWLHISILKLLIKAEKNSKMARILPCYFFFISFFLSFFIFFLQNWKSMLTCNLVYFTGDAEWKWDQQFCPPWSCDRPIPQRPEQHTKQLPPCIISNVTNLRLEL